MAPAAGALQGAIAATRFGLGARPGEIEAASADPQGWLIAQIRPEGADQPEGPAPTSVERMLALYALQAERKRLSTGKAAAPQTATTDQAEALKAAQKALIGEVGQEFLARARLGASTPASFRERWALFWADHFTVSATKEASAVVVGAFEREAIRPHVFGRFEDLLVASSQHPGMLLYLDQAQSFGPDSLAARDRKVGLNENLAREIMELHTVGADAGYTQADVTEFARALTGWSVGGPNEPDDVRGRFMFRARAHEPGSRTIMGRRYAEDGEGQARRVLHDLAANPHTARRISRKIAVHFVADDPPPALVERLSRAWMGPTAGSTWSRAPWSRRPKPGRRPAQVQAPYEFLVSSYRAVGGEPDEIGKIAPVLTGLGQKPFSAPSPKGWPEAAAEWAAPDAVIKRLEYAKAFAAKAGPLVDPVAVADRRWARAWASARAWRSAAPRTGASPSPCC